ncbi:unnamed protein product [Vitrella brassicaformis CCMP3155]|uniref:Uncharacterized protein n=1 Tax=Vitrella brassicaformis (strain CCMP3155) TaxID=1169540 RepID=A0A0G4F5J2_VITBC|nr:unnamed protein product [Vitrella brassicaformis CCMP3155]|eukprot:CEM07755.1 unnamed protein product [Vitrella brassicaformis CCMP3155]
MYGDNNGNNGGESMLKGVDEANVAERDLESRAAMAIYSGPSCSSCTFPKRLLYLLLVIGLLIWGMCGYMAIRASRSHVTAELSVRPTFAMFAEHANYCRKETRQQREALTQQQESQQQQQQDKIHDLERESLYWQEEANKYKALCERLQSEREEQQKRDGAVPTAGTIVEGTMRDRVSVRAYYLAEANPSSTPESNWQAASMVELDARHFFFYPSMP